ncbi:hypothetical protein SNE40_011119 [Patella caerulea]|uniref:Uncharacterized protein n=1 Tax=Patella caerulea TaxID=87958 RepID=A0AAN8PVM8_PATCE
MKGRTIQHDILIAVLVIGIVTVYQTECSSDSGVRFRSSGWAQHQAAQAAFQPWQHMQTHPRVYQATSGQYTDNSNSNSYSNSNSNSDSNSNSGYVKPQPVGHTEAFYQQNAQPPKPHHPPNPFYHNNDQQQPDTVIRGDPNPFYQQNIPPQPPVGAADPFYQQNVPAQPNTVIAADPDPFYQNNIQPQQIQPVGAPGPFYGNNVQPQPIPQPSYGPDTQPDPRTVIPLGESDPNVFYGAEPVNPTNTVYGPNTVPQGDPDLFYENNVNPNGQPKPVTHTVIDPDVSNPLHSYQPDNQPSPVLVGPGEPNPFFEINRPIVPNPVYNPINSPISPGYAEGVEPDPVYTPTSDVAEPTVIPAEKKQPEPTYVRVHASINVQEPPAGTGDPTLVEDKTPEKPKAIVEDILYNDQSIKENEPQVLIEEEIPKKIKENRIYDDGPNRRPVLNEEEIPKKIKENRIYDDGPNRRPVLVDDEIPNTIVEDRIYNDKPIRKPVLVDEEIPNTIVEDRIYNDDPIRVEPDKWETTPCYSGAIVCSSACSDNSLVGGIKYCCPGCTGYKIQFKGNTCSCLRKVTDSPEPAPFDNHHPDIITPTDKSEPNRGDVAYTTRGNTDLFAEFFGRSSDDSPEPPLVGRTAPLVGHDTSHPVPDQTNTITNNKIYRNPKLDQEILSSVFGTPDNPNGQTETQNNPKPANQAEIDNFIQDVFSNGNPFDIKP